MNALQDSTPLTEVVVTDAAAEGTALAEAEPHAYSLDEIGNQQQLQSELMLTMAQVLTETRQLAVGIAQNQIELKAAIQGLLTRIEQTERISQVAARHAVINQSGRLRCVFLVHHPTAWAAIREIVDVMQESPDFEPIVMSLPHRFSILNRMGGEEEVHDMLTAQGYAHVRVRDDQQHLALDHVATLAPGLVFRQAPWDRHLPDCLSAEKLSFTRLCYVPYGYMTARIEAQQFDQQLHRSAWRIFCPDDAHLQLHAQCSLFSAHNCRVTGYPKFDNLARHAATPGNWPLERPASGPHPYRLIWAPHHSFHNDWLRFGVFDQIATSMVELARKRRDLQIVLRPHPTLREALLEAKPGSALQRFLAEWLGLPNAALSTEQEYGDLFAASDAMMTDGLSFFSEYQLFDRPLVFFERPGHVGFNAAGEQLLPGMYRVETLPAFVTLLDQLVRGEDHVTEQRDVRVARHRIAAALRPYPGEAAARIVDTIRREWASA